MMVPEVSTSASPRMDEISLSELFRPLWLERRFIIVICLGFAVIAALYGYALPPVYKAEVVVQIKGSSAKSGGGLAGFAAVAGMTFGGDQTTEATLGTLRSRDLMRDLIRKLKIEDTLLEANEKGFPRIELLGSNPSSRDPVQRLEQARVFFQQRIMTFTDDKRTGLSSVTITWSDPEIAANWANQYVVMANDRLRELAIERARMNLNHLNTELAKASITAIQQAMYRLIEEQVKAIMVATVEREFAIRVIDPATKPLGKDSPKPMQIVTIGILLGLILAVTMVIVRYRLFPHRSWPLMVAISRTN